MRKHNIFACILIESAFSCSVRFPFYFCFSLSLSLVSQFLFGLAVRCTLCLFALLSRSRGLLSPCQFGQVVACLLARSHGARARSFSLSLCLCALCALSGCVLLRSLCLYLFCLRSLRFLLLLRSLNFFFTVGSSRTAAVAGSGIAFRFVSFRFVPFCLNVYVLPVPVHVCIV